MQNAIILGDNLDLLRQLPNGVVNLVYVDPPFNTGNRQQRNGIGYEDSFENLVDFLAPRFVEAYRVLADDGSFFVHADYREIHYIKVYLDTLFGRESFINEIVWVYDYGARSKSRWSTKHDNILWYAKNPSNYTFNYAEIERIPYMAPGLVGAEKAEKGKTLTDAWWHTIVPTNGKEKTGYPTQKPIGVLKRIVAVHSKPKDLVLDFFAGSGTTGEAAGILDRHFLLFDKSVDAVRIMQSRLAKYNPIVLGL